MEAAKTPKKLKEMSQLLKRKENVISAKINAPIPQTSSERLKLTLQTYEMRNKGLRMKLGKLQEEISKASFPVSADLNYDFTSIILENDRGKIYPS